LVLALAMLPELAPELATPASVLELELELANLELEQALALELASLELALELATLALGLGLEQELANLELVQVLATLVSVPGLVLRRSRLPHMEMNTSSCLVGCTGHHFLHVPIPLHIQNQMQTIVRI